MENDYIERLIQGWSQRTMPSNPIIDPTHCEECFESNELLNMRDWRDVLQDFPDYCYDVFPLLSDKGKLYYLPSYMGSAIIDDHNQSISVESYFKSDECKFSDFTRQEISLIIEWIDIMTNEFDDPTSVLSEKFKRPTR